MNFIFLAFIKVLMQWDLCNVNVTPRYARRMSLTLHETHSVHTSMTVKDMKLISQIIKVLVPLWLIITALRYSNGFYGTDFLIDQTKTRTIQLNIDHGRT